jgi:hypothetical protein
MYSGMIVSWPGTIMVARKTMNSGRRPQKSIRANA